MKASELIEKLQTNIELFGDLEMRYQFDGTAIGLVDGIVYTKHSAEFDGYLTMYDEDDKPCEEEYASGDKLIVKEVEMEKEIQTIEQQLLAIIDKVQKANEILQECLNDMSEVYIRHNR